MCNLIVFAGPEVDWSPAMTEAFLKAANESNDIESISVCVTSEDAPRPDQIIRSAGVFLGKALFNPGAVRDFEHPKFKTITSVAKKYGAEVITPPQYQINDPAFVQTLRDRYAPTLALSLGCLQIWGNDLLNTFDVAVNFHNGYLPDYKGLWATHWSIYRGEEFSGYAFHVMDRDIDTGPIILRGRVPVLPDECSPAVERRKIKAAQRDVKEVLAAMTSGQLEAIAQPGSGSYFSGKASAEIWTIDDPRELTAAEILRRIRCFAPLQIRINGAMYPVTSLRPGRKRAAGLMFTAADGVALYPDRLQYLPVPIYKAFTKNGSL